MREYNVLVPSRNAMIYMQDGDGSQLLREDRNAGFNDYVDYEIVEGPQAGDGGIFMYDNANVTAWTDKIEDAIRYIYDIPDDEECPEFELKEVV